MADLSPWKSSFLVKTSLATANESSVSVRATKMSARDAAAIRARDVVGP